MKSILICLLLLCSIMDSRGEFEIPEDISQAIATAGMGESGGFGIRDIDEAVFYDYIRANWRQIVENIEVLPLGDPGPGGSFLSEEDAIRASVRRFSAACESLPPMEYLEFLETMIGLYEQERISFKMLERGPFMPAWRKRDFLSVNWEHPRVAAILSKIIELTPPEEEAFLSLLQSRASGELADSYMYDRSDEDELPETLPGIKLQRPWASLIRQYERITGKKVPHDPKYDGPRPERRGSSSPDAPAGDGEEAPSSRPLWPWLVFAVVTLPAAFLLWKRRMAMSR